jgi:protein-L-isoaspartate O-methyltransferase
VIREKKSWPVLRAFSHLRENLVEWLPFTGEERVLEIGAGCGALTGILAKKARKVTCVEPDTAKCQINAARTGNLGNVRILAGTLDLAEEKLEETYDKIFLIGALPRAAELVAKHPVERSGRPFHLACGAEPEISLLRYARAHLAPGGQIILAQENRLGMKYWAGCRDEYSGRYFTGLEGEQSGGRTFSRKELQELIRQTGGLSAQFYYPYPDHQFPLSLYSDDYLPKKGDLKDNF